MRGNRVAIAIGTLVGGTVTLTWKDPDTVDGVSPVQVELELVPKVFWVQRISNGASPGHLRLTVTKTGCTVTSSDGADTGQVRVYAVCRASDLGGM